MIQISLRWYYRFKVALRLEIRLAGLAIVVEVRLTVVLMQTIFIGEQPFATWTIIVGVFVVILQFTKVVEMFIATLAIWVARTLNPMFFQRLPGRKILRAILADVVRRGIGLMLIKSWQRSVNAIHPAIPSQHVSGNFRTFSHRTKYGLVKLRQQDYTCRSYLGS